MVGDKITPMMRQFLDLKNQYSDCILLFRAGDFYETFYDDAKVASKVLGITLTKRGSTPMAGVPHHSITPYIRKLVQNNYKVAMCEQLEDPKQAKGIVKRGVTRVITPGTILEDEYLSSFENNFIMCIYSPKNISEKWGVALVDITTGEFLTTQVASLDDVKTVIRRYVPNEIIMNESSFVRGLKEFVVNAGIYYNFLSDIRFNVNYSNEILKKQFGLNGYDLGIEYDFSIIASGALLFYIYKLQKLDLEHINNISYVNLSSNMVLDSISLRNLEICESVFSNDKKKTLFGILDNCKTAGGGRLMKKHLTAPLIDAKEIDFRLNGVTELNELLMERDELSLELGDFYDIERITARIASGVATPKDLYALKLSLEKLPEIKKSLGIFNSDILKFVSKIDTLDMIYDELDRAVVSSAPSHTRDIGYLKKNYTDELLKLFDLAFNSKDYLRELEESERLNTGIATLRIKYNRVFGYFIEIPKTQIAKVPDSWVATQTLTNSARYTKNELKQKESEILGAEEKIRVLEKDLFDSLVIKLKKYVKSFQDISSRISILDVLISNSVNSQMFNYVRPSFADDTHVVEGRNALIERFVSSYISNDVVFDSNESFKVVTGPNMSGKSSFLRQNAIISIMAQAGMFVPAKIAKLKIYDRVFTRIGAHDELAEGQSTFMVEMSEVANILNNASSSSLVLLDEVGRGTSTYDGLAIAWAITEDLALKQCDTIFATHYHQLNKLSEFYSNIENYNVEVREEGDDVEFIRKIVKGGTDKSYGIYVGKLAGIPSRVLDRAKEVQVNIEEKEEIIIKQEFEKSMRDISGKLKLKKNYGKSKKLDEFM